MKIAFLNLYQGKVDRGAETFVYELSKRLSKSHEVDVIAGDSLPQKRWPVLWRIFLDPSGLAVAAFTVKNLGKILREKYDIVIPANGGWQPGLVRLATWLYGGKMLISGQSGMGWDDINNLWCFPDAFLALSSEAKRWVKKINPFVRAEYIPNGVDLGKFTFKGASFKVALNRPIVLCVGALTKQKRIELTIKAVSKLSGVNLLVAAGGGDREKVIKNLGDKLLKGKFQLIKVPFGRMPDVYRAADIFTLVPESSEAFGNVYVEAMATNLPVVAVDDEQRREIVGEAGMFVNPTDTKAYAKALTEALNKNWGDRPRRQAQKFDWDKIAQAYERLFKSLFASKQGIL